jgi:hypothetical protein
VLIQKFVREKMAPKKMTMGERCRRFSVLSSKLHPSEHIRAMWPNPEKSHRVENLVALRQEVKKNQQT